MNWFVEVVKKYAVFSGRAHRTEYWMFMLFYLLFYVGLVIVENVVGSPGILTLIYSLALLVPSISVTARRLHDTGRSAWWILIALVPLVGWIVLLVFTVLDGTPGDNVFGPDPKGRPAAA